LICLVLSLSVPLFTKLMHTHSSGTTTLSPPICYQNPPTHPPISPQLSIYAGNRYEIECKYTQTVNYTSRPVTPRLDLGPLAALLNSLEAPSGGQQQQQQQGEKQQGEGQQQQGEGEGQVVIWGANRFTDSGPMLRMDVKGRSLTKAQRYGECGVTRALGYGDQWVMTNPLHGTCRIENSASPPSQATPPSVPSTRAPSRPPSSPPSSAASSNSASRPPRPPKRAVSSGPSSTTSTRPSHGASGRRRCSRRTGRASSTPRRSPSAR
jgi:hypothetical protein